MRVTKEKLIDLAKAEAEKQAKNSDVISAYIIGSVASGNPFLGGTADVDLVLIHESAPSIEKEIQALSEEFHLDITHHSRELYSKPTNLRIDPWLGPSICEPVFLFDPQHFFERAQAGVRGRFHRPDFVHTRAQAFLSRARNIKTNINSNGGLVPNFLQILMEASNALATLSGFPAAGRRMALILEARLQNVGGDRFFERFQALMGARRVEMDHISNWLIQWNHCAQETLADDDLVGNSRHRYYYSGLHDLLSQGRPEIMLWNLIDRWGENIALQDNNSLRKEHWDNWEKALAILGLHAEDHAARSEELENFLDDIEEFIQDWADQHGA